MNRVVGSKRMPIRERGGFIKEFVGHIEAYVALPIRVQHADEALMVAYGNVACPTAPSERSAGLDICDG